MIRAWFTVLDALREVRYSWRGRRARAARFGAYMGEVERPDRVRR